MREAPFSRLGHGPRSARMVRLSAGMHKLGWNRLAGAPEFQWKTITQGAATSLWAAIRATAEEVAGLYCEYCHVAERQENPDARFGVRSYTLDGDHAKALWALSEKMVGESV